MIPGVDTPDGTANAAGSQPAEPDDAATTPESASEAGSAQAGSAQAGSAGDETTPDGSATDPLAQDASSESRSTPDSPAETRRSRRRREAASVRPELPPTADQPHPILAGVTVAAAVALGVGALVDPIILAVLYAALGVLLAWSVPELMSLRPAWPIMVPVAVAGLGTAVAGAVTDAPPYLELAPVALAGATVLACLLQILRRDGRAGLTLSLAGSGAGMAFVAMGACYLPVVRNADGSAVILCVLAGIVASAAADLLVGRGWPRPSLVLVAGALGAVAGVLVALMFGEVTVVAGLLLGLLSAGLAFAVRRVATGVVAIVSARAQVAAAVASTFAPGVVAYVVGRMFIG